MGPTQDFVMPTYTPPTTACDVVKEARLVDEFRFALDDFDNLVEQLAARLNPVSRSDVGDQACDSFPPAPSAARHELYRIHALMSSVRGIIERLEV